MKFIPSYSKRILILPALVLFLTNAIVACSDGTLSKTTTTDDKTNPQITFVENLKTLCGQTLTGAVVSEDPQDADWRGEALTVGPVRCTETRFVMPLAVGEDKSRVWTISTEKTGLKLSHAHTLKDGTPDPVTGYGGMTTTLGTTTSQAFPADRYSKDLFNEHGLEASVSNVWELELILGSIFAYELNREGRYFRAEFDIQALKTDDSNKVQ